MLVDLHGTCDAWLTNVGLWHSDVHPLIASYVAAIGLQPCSDLTNHSTLICQTQSVFTPWDRVGDVFLDCTSVAAMLPYEQVSESTVKLAYPQTTDAILFALNQLSTQVILDPNDRLSFMFRHPEK